MQTDRSYTVFPLGSIQTNNQNTTIHLNEQWRPATKHLGHFGHINIIWWAGDKGENSPLATVPDDKIAHIGAFASRDAKRPNPLRLTVAKLLNVDPEDGALIIEDHPIPQGARVLDIKAYFPLEDRIRQATEPPWYELTTQKSNLANNLPSAWSKGSTTSLDMAPIAEIRLEKGTPFIQVFPPFRKGLTGLAEFSHLRVLFWFNRFDKASYRRTTQCNPPYKHAPRTGVFASRSPVRPNPIGLTTVRIESLDPENGVIMINEIDAFDHTPVLDLKPYSSKLERMEEIALPPWLSHWPQWFDEGDPHLIDVSDLTPAPIERFGSKSVAAQSNPIEIFTSSDTVQDSYQDRIEIQGARQNNLKNITVSIPKGKLTVITGVSGSGKSSLAFDTLVAEGQRRYMDSISSNTAGGQPSKPEVDRILGMNPVIAIEQKTLGRNPRSTVGTLSDIYDHLRLLYTKIGTFHCPGCGQGIIPAHEERIVEQLMSLEANTTFQIQATPDRAMKRKELICEMIMPKSPKRDSAFSATLRESVRHAYEVGNGYLTLLFDDQEIRLTRHFACPECDRIYFDLTPTLFSFNHPEGMCQTCNGLGVTLEIDTKRLISQPTLSLLDGASDWFGVLRNVKPSANWMRGELFAMAEEMGVDLELPWEKLPENFRTAVLYGTGDKVYTYTYDMGKRGRKGEITRPAVGIINNINRLLQNSKSSHREGLTRYMTEQPCGACGGERLAPAGRFVTVAGLRLPELNAMTVAQLHQWVVDLPGHLNKAQWSIAKDILHEIHQRLGFLTNVGLHYLTLDRAAPTLSGGEGQRIRLATQLGSGLTGLLYILDEPSMGLHAKDQVPLLKTLRDLRSSGNTVVVVEHDKDAMLAADYLIDIGPGAGRHGGTVVASGTPDEVMADPESITGRYLKGELSVGQSLGVSKPNTSSWLTIKGACLHNLKNVTAAFPLGKVTCVSGVSGSGKSSLVSKTLSPAIAARLEHSSNDIPGYFLSMEGVENLDSLVNVTQTPIGRTPRSNPGTYVGVFEEIRKLYAGTQRAKQKKYKTADFSTNTKGGRCEACKGLGWKKIDMHFLPDQWTVCDVCHGQRYIPEILEIMYHDKSISQVLEMDVETALLFFKGRPKITSLLETLYDVGLGYIKLGQNATTLSGGEAQRVKLAKELTRPNTGNTLFILDEPTTGLHFSDIEKLLTILHQLAHAGNTVIVVEHQLDVIRSADWVIDMGPGGGDAGGTIVAAGPPAQIAKHPASQTGRFLRQL